MSFLLSPWIKNAKIRCCINSIPNCPLPATWILHRRVINKLRSEISLALMPIEKKIFRKERCHYHSTPIMHPPCCIELSHGSIHNRKACSTLLPGFHMLIIILPFDGVKFLLEGFPLQNFGKVIGNICIKLTPMDFVY